ncbi:MAG: glutathione S-transferase N-terminal domain-containing protein [Hyphomicrobiaceae bacterium]
MALELYDLAGADPDLRFSPYCWRTKMALKHKGLAFEGLPWRFTEKERLANSGQGRVPVLRDGATIVHDSWAIADYLDRAYPDHPMLMVDAAARASALFLQSWSDRAVLAALRPIAVKAVLNVVANEDRAYFEESRAKGLGAPIEAFCSPEAVAQGYRDLEAALKPLERVLSDHAYLGGERPFYGDYIVFGSLMWPRIVVPGFALPAGPQTIAWFDRLEGLFNGYAGSAPRVAAAA